jgi:rod shape-determining protein MreD
MLHLFVLTLFGLGIILAQGSLPSMAIRPNPVIVIAIYTGQFYPPLAGLLISFILGYSLDLMSGGLRGLNAFSMVTVSYISYFFGKRIIIQNRSSETIVVFSFYILYAWIVYLLFRFFNIEVYWYPYLKGAILDGAVAAFLSLPIISAIRWMERFFRFENERAAAGDIKV